MYIYLQFCFTLSKYLIKKIIVLYLGIVLNHLDKTINTLFTLCNICKIYVPILYSCGQVPT